VYVVVVFAALLALGLVICKARLDGQKQWPVLFLYNLPINKKGNKSCGIIINRGTYMYKKGFLISVILLTTSVYFPILTYAETIILKSGKTIEGKLIEKTDKYIKIDFYGVPLTYYIDEIKSIDGVDISFQSSIKTLPLKTSFQVI
jgi:hypothetical protein